MGRHTTCSVMSEQERPPRPQAKHRPEIPPKPPAQPEPAPLRGSQSASEGKVKSIVNKFSKQDSEEGALNGSLKLPKIKRLKRPPTIKPKPGRASLPLQIGERAPPLPMKRSRKPKEAAQTEQGNFVDVKGSRSGTVIIHD